MNMRDFKEIADVRRREGFISEREAPETVPRYFR